MLIFESQMDLPIIHLIVEFALLAKVSPIFKHRAVTPVLLVQSLRKLFSVVRLRFMDLPRR